MIITLHDAMASAAIDTLGAQLVSYKDSSGREYIWQRDPNFWGNCSPILFPIVGALRDGRTMIGGQIYEIPKHGFVKTSELAAEQNGPNRAVFTLLDSESTRSMYPFPFCLKITYDLTDGILSMSCLVENTGTDRLPYFIGTHPGFICPLFEGEAFEDYVLEFEEEETEGYRSYDMTRGEFDLSRRLPFPGDGKRIPLSYELFLNDAIWFDTPRSRKARLLNPATGHGIEASFPDYDTVAFWTMADKKAPFLCIEPWNGSAPCSGEGEAFTDKNHLQTLSPGESRQYRLIIRYL